MLEELPHSLQPDIAERAERRPRPVRWRSFATQPQGQVASGVLAPVAEAFARGQLSPNSTGQLVEEALAYRES